MANHARTFRYLLTGGLSLLGACGSQLGDTNPQDNGALAETQILIPKVTSISPSVCKASGGCQMTILGSNLLNTKLSIGGVPIPIDHATASMIQFTAPALPGQDNKWLNVNVTNGKATATLANSVYFLADKLAFSIPGMLYAPTGPRDVAVGDFNRDGISDLAVIATVTNHLHIFFGDGKGGFTAAGPAIPVGVNPQAIVVGQFNNDTDADLAVANTGADTVSVLLGNGTGQFSPFVPGSTTRLNVYSVSGGPNTIAVADLQGNGVKDIVTTSVRSCKVNVLQGQANSAGLATGAFQNAGTYSLPFIPQGLLVENVLGNNLPDIVVVGSPAGPSGNSLAVLTNNSGGWDPFGSICFGPITYPLRGYNLRGVAAKDLDGDGKPDLVLTDIVGQNLLVLNGTRLDYRYGSTLPTPYPLGNAYQTVVIEDRNHDGKPDVVVAGPLLATTSKTATLLGNGNGTFQPAQTFDTGVPGSSARLVDVTSDHIADLVVLGAKPLALPSSTDGVAVLAGNGLNFTKLSDFSDGGPGADPASAVFVNLGLAGTVIVEADATQQVLKVWTPDATGSLSVTDRLPMALGRSPQLVQSIDTDGDGTAELLVVASSSCSGTAGTNCTTWVTTVKPDLNGKLVAPLAIQDVAIGTGIYFAPLGLATGTNSKGTRVALTLQNGSVVIIDVTAIATGQLKKSATSLPTLPMGLVAMSPVLADLNNDSYLDLVVALPDANQTGVYLDNGMGTITGMPKLAPSGGQQPMALQVLKFDGDTYPRIVVANQGNTGAGDFDIATLSQKGAGDFLTVQKGASLSDCPGASTLSIADFNGDGIPDLLATCSGRLPLAQLQVYLGIPRTSLTSPSTFGATGSGLNMLGYGPVAAGTLSGETLADVLVVDETLGTLTLLRNLGIAP